MKWFLCCCCAIISTTIIAQEKEKTTYDWAGYVEAYYIFDGNRPPENIRDPWYYNHRRHNEVAVNLALLRLKAQREKYRAALGLMAGTYAQHNLAHEPQALRLLYEARAGIAVNKKNTLWLDAGIFESFIGFETPIGSNNMNLTRGLSSENSPYYLSGARLSYEGAVRWELAGYLLNGWQQLQNRGSGGPALGMHILFKAHKNWRLNWNLFAGPPDGRAEVRRYFSNFFLQYHTGRWKAISGWDVGQEVESTSNRLWQAAYLIAQYQLTEVLKMAWRAEYFHDPTLVVVQTPAGKAFQVWGGSVNLDWSPHPNAVVRWEYRYFQNSAAIFRTTKMDNPDAIVPAFPVI